MNTSFPIYYETVGNSENPCILLVNGLGAQLIHWPSAFIEGLVNQGFYVVLFDNRDIGLSRYYDEYGVPDIQATIATLQQGKGFKPPYTLYDMAADAIAVLDKLHIKKAHVVGMSILFSLSVLVGHSYGAKDYAAIGRDAPLAIKLLHKHFENAVNIIEAYFFEKNLFDESL